MFPKKILLSNPVRQENIWKEATKINIYADLHG